MSVGKQSVLSRQEKLLKRSSLSASPPNPNNSAIYLAARAGKLMHFRGRSSGRA